MGLSDYKNDDRLLESSCLFVEQVFRIGSWKGELPAAASLPIGAARAMARVVLAHPTFADGADPSLQLRLFGPTDDPVLETLRGHSVGYLIAGALALGMAGHDIEKLAPRLVLAATSVDPESLLLRQRLVNDRPSGPPIPVLPKWLERLETFIGRKCYAGVARAVHELGRWASGGDQSDAKGITGLSSTTVCSGNLTIYGSGFGTSQPAKTSVYVPVVGGGCRSASVAQWSDSAITIKLPADIAAGCVGFVRAAQQSFGGIQTVTGELTTCIGAVAEIWTRGFDRIGPVGVVSCPPCLSTGANRIHLAGRPVVNAFTFAPSHVEPNGQPVLTWNVSNASATQISGVSGGGPALALPNPLPLVGSTTLPPVGGLAPVVARYRITASNPCGVTTADAEFTMTRAPALSVTRIEVVQAIQRIDNSVRLTATRRTAVRVFVDSGISDGFDFGHGPNRVAGIEGSLYAESLDDGSMWSCGSQWAANGEATSTPNRDHIADSINFDVPLGACHGNIRFRAVVTAPGGLGQPPQSFAAASVDVSFTEKSKQEILPLLITDPSSNSPAPTMADFFETLSGPRRAQPFAENGSMIRQKKSWVDSGSGSLPSE